KREENRSRVQTPKVLTRSLRAHSPSPLGFCNLCRSTPVRSVREQGGFRPPLAAASKNIGFAAISFIQYVDRYEHCDGKIACRVRGVASRGKAGIRARGD